MIRITIEKVPWGIESRKHRLCTGEIWNDTTGTRTRGNYEFRFTKQGAKQIWRRGKVKGFARKRENVWRLLLLCLKQAIEGEKC